MRESILNYLCCPLCHATDWNLFPSDQDEREIRQGQLVCAGCQHRYLVDKGIVNLLPDPGPVIQSEQQGWVDLLGETSDELIETMLKLPYLENDLWVTTYENFDQAMAHVNVTGKRVLDIGAGRCWSSRRMVMAGACYVIGLDILLERFIGLETADIFLQRDGMYFERVLGDMNNLPLRPGSFDIVFMTGTLHHSSDPGHTMRQVADALTEDGIAVVINEPVYSLLRSKSLSGCSEVEYGINEHVYRIYEYWGAARRAGLRPALLFPRSIERGLERHEPRVAQEMGKTSHAIVSRLWQFDWARRAMHRSALPILYYVTSMPLVMIAHKSR